MAFTKSERYIGMHSHAEGGGIKRWNINFWNVINGVKAPNNYFIGKGFEDEEMFVAVLKDKEGCINIEKSEKAETIYYWTHKFLNQYSFVFLIYWVEKIQATIAFLRLKHKYNKLSEEDITAFRVAEKLSGTSYSPSEVD